MPERVASAPPPPVEASAALGPFRMWLALTMMVLGIVGVTSRRIFRVVSSPIGARLAGAKRAKARQRLGQPRFGSISAG